MEEGNVPSNAVRRNRFQWRAWVALMLFGGIVALAITGVVLFLAPSGRVSKMIEWRFLWLDKKQWVAAHTIFGLVFTVAAGLHLKYNWRSILAYLRGRAEAVRKMRREAVWATATLVLLTLASIYGWPPVPQIMYWGEQMDAVWLRWGEQRGYTVLVEEEHEVDEEEHEYDKGLRGRGYGRLSVAELAQQEGVPLELALERLAQAGVTARPEDNLLTLSGRTARTPGELAEIVRGEDASPSD